MLCVNCLFHRSEMPFNVLQVKYVKKIMFLSNNDGCSAFPNALPTRYRKYQKSYIFIKFLSNCLFVST